MGNYKGTKNYRFLSGDVNYKDYGGKWYKLTDEREYYVIELVNMDNATGNTEKGKYLFLVYSIDLNDLTFNDITNALNCSGITDRNIDDLMLLEACVSYGLADL